MRMKPCAGLLALVASLLPAMNAAAASADAEEAKIKSVLVEGCKATVAKSTDGMIAPFLKTTPDHLTMFDMGLPRSRNYAQLRQADADFAAAIVGAPRCSYLEIHPVLLSSDAAYSWAIMQAGGTLRNGQKIDLIVRSTDVWKKANGQWKIIHEHNSFPVDMATGKADLQSAP